MVDKKDAVEVVDFVKDSSSEEAADFKADALTVNGSSLDASLIGAGNEAVDIRNREAAFVIFDGAAFGADNFGVDQGNKGRVRLIVGIFANDDNAAVVAELGGSHGGRDFKFVFIFPSERRSNHLVDDFFGFGVGGVSL